MPGKKKVNEAFGKTTKQMDKMLGGKGTTKKISKKIMSFDDALKKYGGDVTKIPGWTGRGMDGKVKPKKKTIKKKGK
jgi:hypothetical protein